MITYPHAQRRGVALVLVLSFLVLISVFVIGFFISANSELQASGSYAATVTTQQLSDTATNMVMGLIREATTRPGEVWASQPGMLRTFRTEQAVSYYKLYSSNKMVVEGTARGNGEAASREFRAMDADVPVGSEGWNHKPALFVDMNDPVRVPIAGSELGVSGLFGRDYEYRYPIFDPASFTLRENDLQAGNFLTSAGANPADETVEGAEIIRNQSDDSSNSALGKEKKTVFTRMPVRWLYILKDGTITCPDRDQKGTLAQWTADSANPAALPTAQNPIVGRIAYWTDDETCKVNINTAGGFSNFRATASGKSEDMYPGSYWDSPRFFTIFDRGIVNSDTGEIVPSQQSLALSQPARNEFQRFPGHPSTVSLGLLFKNLLTSRQIYDMSPRLMHGGSDGGTLRPIQAKTGEENKALKIRRDRLYASVDELLMAAPKDGDPLTQPRRLNSAELAAPVLTPKLVNRMRFFLTAHSRAPELNVFGRPRVTIWPLWPYYAPSSGKYTTAQGFNANGNSGQSTRSDFQRLVNKNPTEKLIVFCSTIGPKNNDTAIRPYFFQRSNPYSATDDANIPRNQRLFKYLVDLMGQPVLGSAGPDVNTPATFQDKYPGEQDTEGGTTNGNYRQIIAEIFDYIRCVNLNDTSQDEPAPAVQAMQPTESGYQFNGKSYAEYKYSPHGYVVPSVVPGALAKAPGFGRFPTISEAVLVFYHAGYLVWEVGRQPELTKKYAKVVLSRKEFYDRYAERNSANQVVLDADGKPKPGPQYMGRFMRAFMLFESFNPMQGYTAMSSFDYNSEVKSRGLFFQHELTGVEGWRVTSMNMPPAGQKSYGGLTGTQSKDALGNLNFPPSLNNKYTKNRFWDAAWTGYYGYAALGGIEGFFQTLQHGANPNPPLSATALAAVPPDAYYPFQSTRMFSWPTSDAKPTGFMTATGALAPVTPDDKVYIHPSDVGNETSGGFPGIYVPKTDNMFSFNRNGGIGHLKVSFSGTTSGTVNAAGSTVVSTLDLKFPDSPVNGWPVPTDNLWAVDKRGGYWHEDSQGQVMDMSSDGRTRNAVGGRDPVGEQAQFTLAARIAWSRKHALNPWLPEFGNIDGESPDNRFYGTRGSQILLPGDTVRSLIPFNPNTLNPKVVDKGMGDPRALALVGSDNNLKGEYLKPHPDYASNKRRAQGLRTGTNVPFFGKDNIGVSIDKDHPTNGESKPEDSRLVDTKFGNMLVDPRKPGTPMVYQSGVVTSDLPPNVTEVYRSDALRPDFDTGLALSPDGAYLNKSDEGAVSWRHWDSLNKKWIYDLPYYASNREGGFDTYFSPNKQMPSAVQFGSLLAGRTKHWQTLAFCPNALGFPHPGITKAPKDHYLLDFFTMPVVEPYAISEPFSTAGKINLNYAMAPFSHIRRSTAMRAALHPMRIVAVPNDDSNLYKQTAALSTLLKTRNFRFRINRDETLKAFDDYFLGKSTGYQEIFRTGSQICEMYFYPNMLLTESATGTLKEEARDVGIDAPKYAFGGTAMKNFWNASILTGDNLKEKPYNDLYPRITTKSNTYTVHMWVQALKKSSTIGLNTAEAEQAVRSWNENKDQVIAEYRGSTTIERYIDPEDRRFDPNNPETKAKADGVDPDTTSIESLYRFRVVESKRFAP